MARENRSLRVSCSGIVGVLVRINFYLWLELIRSAMNWVAEMQAHALLCFEGSNIKQRGLTDGNFNILNRFARASINHYNAINSSPRRLSLHFFGIRSCGSEFP